MRIAISGISGFVGSHLRRGLSEDGRKEILPISSVLLYGPSQDLADYLEGSQVVIHLSGANILSRWTSKRKTLIWNSRVQTTQNLVEAFALMKSPPATFISTSAVGIFDSVNVHDEFSQNYDKGFLAELVHSWEEAAIQAISHGIRTSIFRFGVVLGRDGGALGRMLPIFRLGLGGPIGKGDQPFPFVHIDDLVQAYQHVIQEKDCKGIFHLVAPEIITNHEFTRVLSSVLRRPAVFPVPAWVLRLVYGQAAKVLVQGQKVVSNRLPQSGFKFQYPTIEKALRAILS